MTFERLAFRLRWPVLLAGACIATSASAHSLAGGGSGDLASGFAHPFSGLDHQLAMLAIGIWAAQQAGRARLAAPLCFVAGAVLGLGLGALALPATLAAVLLPGSGIVLGLCIAKALRVRLLLASVVALLFGVLHGHAHASEAAALASPALFAIGFTLATALLHAAGLSFGAWATSRPAVWTRATGGAIAAIGTILIAGILA